MIVIRACDGFDELEACVHLQIETWGLSAAFTTPRKVFVVAQKIGGQAIGAFDTELPGASAQGGPDSLVGFAMAHPGIKTARRRATRLFALRYAGRAGELPEPGDWRATQMGATA